MKLYVISILAVLNKYECARLINKHLYYLCTGINNIFNGYQNDILKYFHASAIHLVPEKSVFIICIFQHGVSIGTASSHRPVCYYKYYTNSVLIFIIIIPIQ